MAKPTSEDKLLDIIENPDKARGKKLFAIRQNVNRLKDAGLWCRSLVSKENLSKLLQLKVINKILVGACVCFTFFLVFDYIHQSTKLGNRFMEIKKTEGKIMKVRKDLLALKVNLEESLNLAQGRNIFSLIPPKKKAAPVQAAPAAVQDISLPLRDLKIVGILWSERNPQVMIEDAKENKTYLLQKGDIVKEFEIKSIQKDHVIFGKEGREWRVR